MLILQLHGKIKRETELTQYTKFRDDKQGT
jgi:hypothetical protein